MLINSTIWTYWEDRPGIPTPPHILLCREVLKYQCGSCKIELVTPHNLHFYLPDVNDRIWEISLTNKKQNPIAVRCAFIRAFLLERYGGLYVDADCIALKDYTEVFRYLDNYDFVCIRRTTAKTKHISIGFYASNKDGTVISEYAEKLRKIIKDKTVFSWGEVGAYLLTPIVDSYLEKVYIFRENQIHPTVAENQQEFCSDTAQIKDIIPEDAYCFMLFHRIFEQQVGGQTLKSALVKDLYYGKYLISKVFRMAYPEKEFTKTFGFSQQVVKSGEIMSNLLERKILATRPDTDKVLELTGYWASKVPAWKPLKKQPNSQLRLACIVEERLYQGLRFESQVMLLTPSNWKKTLTYAKPDILLMESIWLTATGHWHMGQCPASPDRNELIEIVSQARRQSIPTVFWFTKGSAYHEHYQDFVRHFDFVFCADPDEADKLGREGVRTEILLPCVQTALYNPFRYYDRYDALNLKILYDGWADLDRMTNDLDILKKLKPHGLSIVESRYQIFKRRKNVLSDYKDVILGCITPQERLTALRYAKANVTFEKTLSLLTTQQWMSLEAAACRLPVVHHGTLAKQDPRKDVVIECPDREEFLGEFIKFENDEMYRQEKAHLGWRKVFQEHTFAHRLQTVCQTIGIESGWTQFPKVSLITPTFRQDMLARCLETFEGQTYPNKELILVFNGDRPPSVQQLGLPKPREDVRVVHVPGDAFAATCLNQGHTYARGVYCFRVDDDDYYGSNYIMDMVLQASCIDADVFGKPPAPIYFEEEKTVYKRNRVEPLTIVSEKLLSKGTLWMGGNSVAGKHEVFREIQYGDSSFGGADSRFIYNVSNQDGLVYAILDEFNLVASRRSDRDSHTWKIDGQQLKENATFMGNDYKIFCL